MAQLKPEIKEKWCAALESGKYPQGTGQLYKAGCYCCLGVLAKIEGRLNEETGSCQWEDYLPSVGDLPRGFRDAIGLDAQDEERLIGMNDSGMSFEAIAAYIRENL